MSQGVAPRSARPRSETRQRQLVMGLRVTEQEAEEIRRRARDRALTVSAFLRAAVLDENEDGEAARSVAEQDD